MNQLDDLPGGPLSFHPVCGMMHIKDALLLIGKCGMMHIKDPFLLIEKCGMMHIKDALLLIGNNSLLNNGSRFPFIIHVVLYHMSKAI